MKSKDENHIRYEFDSFCKKTLKGAARDFLRRQKRRSKHEVNFSDLSPSEQNSLVSYDEYATEKTVFDVQGELVTIRNADLASALEKLTDERRDIILLSHIIGLTDAEIAEMLDMVRRTVAYRKQATLRELRKIMEVNKNE